MKYLKTFENYDLGNRFSEEEEELRIDPEFNGSEEEEGDEDNYDPENDEDFGAMRADGSDGLGYDEEEGDEDFYDEEEGDEKDWNDDSLRLERFSTFNEKKKFSPAQLAAQKKFKERIKGKKSDDKEDDKKAPAKKGVKPDFLDLDKDGDKKEPMKKAAKEAKEGDDKKEEKEEKETKGLTAKQKKLPAALQASILKRQKK
jgi:hypothetical protein